MNSVLSRVSTLNQSLDFDTWEHQGERVIVDIEKKRKREREKCWSKQLLFKSQSGVSESGHGKPKAVSSVVKLQNCEMQRAAHLTEHKIFLLLFYPYLIRKIRQERPDQGSSQNIVHFKDNECTIFHGLKAKSPAAAAAHAQRIVILALYCIIYCMTC